MAKKDKDTAVETTTTVTPDNGTSDTPPPDETTAMVAPGDPYTQAIMDAKNTLMAQLQSLKGRLTEENELADITRLIKTLDPRKRGREEVSAPWTIPVVRIVHGMTKEKPEGSNIGDIYTSNGTVLPRPVKFAPLYMFEMNRMFEEGGFGAPVCVAPDAKLGNQFGQCAKCDNLPMGKNATWTRTDCDNGLCFLVLSDTLKVYRLEFFKTSKKAGERIIKQTDETDEIWDRWLSLDTIEIRSQDRPAYHVFKVSPSNLEVPHHISQMAEHLYDMINAERQAFLKSHWDRVLKGEGSDISTVDENVNPADLQAQGDNPSDLSGAGV